MSYSKSFLKRKYEQMPQVIEAVDRYIQGLSLVAYRNVYLVANEVLSRNPHTQNFFRDLLFEEPVTPPSPLRSVFCLMKYYAQVSLFIFAYLSSHLTYRMMILGRKRKTFGANKPLYVVDTFVYLYLLQQDQKYVERFFTGIYEVLQKCEREFVILPRLLGKLTPINIVRSMEILNRAPYDFLTEFDLLHTSDLLKLVWLLCKYPWGVLFWIKHIARNDLMDERVIVEVMRTLDYNPAYALIRYFVGRRLGELTPALYLVSWCENQVVDKTMFRGVRETAPHAFIFGCQSLIAYPPYLCMHIAESDKKFGMTPDVVLVNGAAFLKPQANVPHKLGVSFRNAELFKEEINLGKKTKTVVFFSYFLYLDFEMVRLASESEILRQQCVSVTLHPQLINTRQKPPQLPDLWSYTQQNRFELLRTAKILITSESSTAVEAAALGTSVIIIASQSTFTCNPMLEGQGEIWEIAFDAEELDLAYRILLKYREVYPERIRALASFYKQNCFVEPSEANIMQAFDLQ